MVSKYCIDTSAWIAYLDDAKHAETIEKLLFDEKNEIFTSIVTVAELASIFNRLGKNREEAIDALQSLSTIVNLDLSIALEAADIHATQHQLDKTFGMVDALIFATAKATGATFVTTDPHFKDLKGTMYLK